jgi:hypothetical protein
MRTPVWTRSTMKALSLVIHCSLWYQDTMVPNQLQDDALRRELGKRMTINTLAFGVDAFGFAMNAVRNGLVN